MANVLSDVFQVRNQSQLPFYGRPISLFIAVWLLMLAVFQLHISYTSYPDISLALVIFAVSLVTFLFGYATVRVAYLSVGYVPSGYSHYQINLTRLRRFHLLLVGIVLAIMLLNVKLHGLPPLFGFIGLDTLDYQEYGSLRQVLFPCVYLIFISAPLETSWMRRWCLLLFAPLCFLIYVSRGLMLIMMFQGLVVLTIRSSVSKRKLYLVAAATLCCALVLTDFIGNGRNTYGSAGMMAYMQIRSAYYDWPTAYLWMISYISTPISNLCWIVSVYHYDHPSASFVYSMLPTFWAGTLLDTKDLGSAMIVDGVHTYIAKWFLDFWYLGVLGINYVWGLIAAYMSAGDRLTRRYLSSAVLLGCLGFIFFSDFLSFLVIMIEFFVISMAQQYFTIGIDRPKLTQGQPT